MRSALIYSIILVAWVLTTEYDVSAQRRGRTVTTGTMRIELLGRSSVNKATIHLYLNDTTLVATQSVKKDSAGDRSRLANIQNLEPGKYTLRIEAPGKPLMEKMAYVRAERAPVKMYLDFPEGRGFAGDEESPTDINALYDAVAELEQRIYLLETRQSPQQSSRPSPRTSLQIQRDAERLPDSVASPQQVEEPRQSWFQRWWKGDGQTNEPEEPQMSRRERRRQEREQREREASTENQTPQE